MSGQKWIGHLLVVAAIWTLDRVSKTLAEQYILQMMTLGPLELVLQRNLGAMLGAFADLPPFMRVVCLSTGGAFLFLIYFSLQSLLLQPQPKLRLGLSILMGGILGNLTDRVQHGAVTDFMALTAGSVTTAAFNFADIAQWSGAAIILYVTFVKDEGGKSNMRKRLWVSPRFQTRYIAILLAMAAGFAGINMVFFATYLRSTIATLVTANSPSVESQFLTPFYLTFSVISVGFLVLLILVGRILSHRMAGPLYAFESFLQDLLAGKSRDLKLREGDEFKHLEELSRQLRKRLEDHRS